MKPPMDRTTPTKKQLHDKVQGLEAKIVSMQRVVDASRKVIGLMCKYGNHASEGCHQCILAKALEALDD